MEGERGRTYEMFVVLVSVGVVSFCIFLFSQLRHRREDRTATSQEPIAGETRRKIKRSLTLSTEILMVILVGIALLIALYLIIGLIRHAAGS
jgi:Na+/melibiose symporter-like transporter